MTPTLRFAVLLSLSPLAACGTSSSQGGVPSEAGTNPTSQDSGLQNVAPNDSGGAGATSDSGEVMPDGAGAKGSDGSPGGSLDGASAADSSDPGSSDDGTANAPTGTPNYPPLLNGYGGFNARVFNAPTFQPPWKVAGVDYRVGINTGVVLKDAATMTVGNNGVTEISGHTIRIGVAGTTLDGWDFTTDGGWQLVLEPDDITVTNSAFNSGANNLPEVNQTGGNNVTFRYCEFDTVGQTADDNIDDANLYLSGVGGVVEYCWLKHAGADAMSINGGGTWTIRYNIFDNNGTLAGSHPDFIQTQGGTYSIVQNFNLGLKGPQKGGTQGFEFTTSTYSGVTLDNNVVIAQAGGNINLPYDIVGGGASKSNSQAENNYYDPTGSSTDGALNRGQTDAVWLNNVNMVTGVKYPDSP